MKVLRLLFFLVLLVTISCNKKNDGFTTHSSGLKYRFIQTNPSGDSPKVGDIVVLSIKFYNDENKLIDGSDFYRMQISRSTYKGDFHTGLQMLQVGDSVCFKLDAASYYENTRKEQLPVELQQGDPIYVYLRLTNILSAASLETERRGYYHTDEAQEIQLLKSYLELTNTQAEPTESGMYIIHKREGSGSTPVAGQTLLVHYTGTTIDGKIFDTSLKKGHPLKFVIGRGEVIKGWDEGFMSMKKGGKARFIIPSKLAYGKQGFGADILPYSTLVFDVELIDIK